MLFQVPSSRRRLVSLLTAAAGLLVTLAVIAGSALAHSDARRSYRPAHYARSVCHQASRHGRHAHARCAVRKVSGYESGHKAKSPHHEPESTQPPHHEAEQFAPASSSPPTVSGTTTQGQTLTASVGSWTGTAPIHYAYQWQCGGADVPGATGSTYALSAGDVGDQMDVVVTASNAVGSNAATSSITAIVASSTFSEEDPSPPAEGPTSSENPPPAEEPSSPITSPLPTETWEDFSESNPMPAGRTPGDSSSPFNQPVGPTPQVLPELGCDGRVPARRSHPGESRAR